MDENLKKLMAEQIKILDAATEVLRDSHTRVSAIFRDKKIALSSIEKESCESLTARFSRLCDFIFQRAFRTIDRIELVDEGTAIDRLNRMEKRRIIQSSNEWQILRDLRNAIAHEYLIEQADRVLREAFEQSQQLFDTVEKIKLYVKQHNYLS